jgi:hypothetical protein
LPRRLYRSVKSQQPTLVDFMSYGMQNRTPPRARQNDPDFLRQWDGLSVFETYAAAWANASLYKWRMGEYIAELVIPDDAPIVYEEPDYKGHLNLYGTDPSFLKSCVVHVAHGPSVRDRG